MQTVEEENYVTMAQLATELGLRKQTLSLYTSHYMLNKYVKYMQSINPVTLRKKTQFHFLISIPSLLALRDYLTLKPYSDKNENAIEKINNKLQWLRKKENREYKNEFNFKTISERYFK